MQPLGFLLLIFSSALADAWGAFRPSVREPAHLADAISNAPSQPPPRNHLLELSPRKPSFYADAMLELKRLEEKPVCHRIAAQLLMSNCQGLEDISKEKYETASASLQRHHIESFAASLAMCDMERAEFEIPKSCDPFRSMALDRALLGSGRIDVSPENVSACLRGLGQDHSHWNTWLSYRDSALLLCRGARIEIEKDEMISLQRELARAMERFTEALFHDMQDFAEMMAKREQRLESYFEKATKQMEDWRAKLHGAFESVSDDVKEVNSALRNVAIGTNDAYQMIRNLVNTVVQSNAEMAASQEHALQVATGIIQTRLTSVSDSVAVAGTQINTYHRMIDIATKQVDILIRRQNDIEETSQRTLHALLNATEVLQSHTHQLTKANRAATEIYEKLGDAAVSVMGLTPVGSALDWVIRIAGAAGSLLVGNFNTVGTKGNNLILVLAGYGIGEMLNIYRHPNWIMSCIWFVPQVITGISAYRPPTFSPRIATWKGGIRKPYNHQLRAHDVETAREGDLP